MGFDRDELAGMASVSVDRSCGWRILWHRSEGLRAATSPFGIQSTVKVGGAGILSHRPGERRPRQRGTGRLRQRGVWSVLTRSGWKQYRSHLSRQSFITAELLMGTGG